MTQAVKGKGMLRGPWRTYVGLFSDSKRLLAWSTLSSITQSVLLIPIAVLVRRIFDQMVHHGDVAVLLLDGGLILVLYLASAGVGLWTQHTVLSATRSAVVRLRVELLERLYRLPQAYFDRHLLAQLHTTIVQDTQMLESIANTLVAQVLPALIVASALAVVLVVEDALLFAVLLAVVPLLLFISRLLGRRVRGRSETWRQAFDVFSAQSHLALRGMKLTKVQATEDFEISRRATQFGELGRANQAMVWLHSAYVLIQGAVSAAAGVVVLMIGGVEVARGSLGLGALLSFYAILALLLRQVTVLLSAIPYVLESSIALERVEAIRGAEDPEPYTGAQTPTFRGSLRLDAVDFGYGRQPLLRNLSLAIEAGERVAIVGPNGAGKTTLVNLILGLYRPDSGRLFADGVPYDDLDLRALRERFGVVLQDPLIFPGTIAENIAYGRPGASMGEIRGAARWATADLFIEDLPEGYETHTGDEGALLSGGQRQRIAIARALIGRPGLLVLDEPTTHLDDAVIAALLSNVRAFPGAPSVLMITHDSEVAREADVIYHLRDGVIVGSERLRKVQVAQ